MTPLEIVLDKEAWMDELPEEEMSELQKAAFSEYQNKEKVRFEAFRGTRSCRGRLWQRPRRRTRSSSRTSCAAGLFS